MKLMKLVIVESPTKTKSLSKYLGNKYQVMATMGHIRDLPKSKMGIEIIEDAKLKLDKRYKFKPEYALVKGKGKQVSTLKSAAKKADEIILATDPDREGEAIAFHTAEILNAKKCSRVVFHAITKEAVLEAFKHLGKIDMTLVNAQQARRMLDRVVGYKLSPVLWRKVRRGLSAGRVQSVAVRLVVEREKEIEAFKPEEYWKIVSNLKIKTSKDKIFAELVRKDNKKYVVGNKKEAENVKKILESSEHIVKSVVKKERRLWPKPPFKTSTLQQAAANRFGWSAKNTMRVAQSLYEHGLITYHRTDSLSFATDAVDKIRSLIKKKYGVVYLPERRVFYKTSGKVVAQEAHEAIRPANLIADDQIADIGGMDQKLYRLIWERTLASQMKPAVVDWTKIVIGASNYESETTGQTVKFDGFRKVWGGDLGELILPEVKIGDCLDLIKVENEQKFTQGPARFNDASLIRELEKRGIGRPSTYAPTISTIIDRGYVERTDKKFFATKVGIVVIEFLVEHFKTEMDYDFTAKMEADLDGIASGKKECNEVLSEFYGGFHKSVEKAIEKAERVKIPTEKTGEKCPECKEGEIIIREGRFGRFLSCDKFPECKHTAPLIEYFGESKCEECGARVVVKKTRTGRMFYGCEKYPKCKWASWKKPLIKNKKTPLR